MKKSPIATKGIAFVEFSGSRPELLRAIFTQMGLAQYGHKSLERTLHNTGDIYFISNPCKGGNAERFREHHGRGVSAIGFLVDDSAAALAQALDLGAEVVQQADYTIPAIKGVGESLIYLVDDNDRKNILAEFGLPSLATEVYNHLLRVDHLTHNLNSGGILSTLWF